MSAVSVKPELIRWAIDRSGLPEDELSKKFPKLHDWRTGKKAPTLKQLESFAKKTMTPLGYLFLSKPPEEKLPIPDFRTVGETPIDRPSPNLIDTIHTMQRRQDWMRDFLIEQGQGELPFVGSAKRSRDIEALAKRIRETLGLAVDWSEKLGTWEDALKTLRNSAEGIGILVATSSVVGLNNHRPLNPQEFRGFVLCDSYAPLIFVNSADSKSAQMFTLAHELVHLWLGKGGLFNLIQMMPTDDVTEKFCNQVAAEFLVPGEKLTQRWEEVKVTSNPFHRIARSFKVSPVVAARRALDLGLITKAKFFEFYKQDQAEWKRRKEQERQKKKKGGPNFYDVQNVRLGRRFAFAVVRAAREGRLLYRDAYQLTDLKGNTFDRFSEILMKRMLDERR